VVLFNAILFVAGVLLLASCTVYEHNMFGWNSQPAPAGYFMQVLGLVGGGALIAFSILFTLTATDYRLPKILRRRS
jgi:hypothetical protein